jgi:hypothetical protein
MDNLKMVLLSMSLAAIGCDSAPDAASRIGVTPEGTPTPVASHAFAGNAPDAAPTREEAVSAASSTAHHTTPPASPELDPAAAVAEAPREITIPAGTTIRLRLGSTVSSRSSNVEDAVQATLRTPIIVNGVTVVPAGAAVSGYVSEARRSGRVKGRARVGVRFNALRISGTRYTMRTASIAREAPGTKKEDATKIGVGAGAGAITGAIAGGKKGAAIGTAVGGGAGTGLVLATRGREVALPRGTAVTTRLTAPLTVRVP